MTVNETLAGRLLIIFHTVGLSCLGGTIFFQVLVFSNIVQGGCFEALETSPVMFTSEIALTFFVCAYFLYVYQRIIRRVK
jgi:hypothetical protein